MLFRSPKHSASATPELDANSATEPNRQDAAATESVPDYTDTQPADGVPAFEAQVRPTENDSTASAACASAPVPCMTSRPTCNVAPLAATAKPSSLRTGAHIPANQICIVSCYCAQRPEVRDFLRDLAQELQTRGVQLLVLATDDPKDLGVPALHVPYLLAEFDSTFPHAGDLPAAHPTALYAVADQIWGSGNNGLSASERGVARCEAFYRSVVEILRPCAAFLWNTTLPHGRIARNVFAMHGVPSYSFERGMLPGTFQIESLENNAFNDLFANFQLSSGLLDDLENLGDPQASYDTIREHYVRYLPSKYPSAQWRDRAALDAQYGTAGKRLIVVFGSAEGSSIAPTTIPSIGYSSPLFHDTSSALQAVCAPFADDPNVAILFQDHPINVSNDTARSLPANCIVTTREHIHTLIAAADRVAVLGTTTVQYECLMYDVPILSLSRNLVDRVGAAYSCVDAGFDNALRDWWADIHASERRLAARRLMVYLCHEHLIGHGESRAFVRRGVEHMAQFAAGLGRENESTVDQRFTALIESIRVLMLGTTQMEAA